VHCSAVISPRSTLGKEGLKSSNLGLKPRNALLKDFDLLGVATHTVRWAVGVFGNEGATDLMALTRHILTPKLENREGFEPPTCFRNQIKSLALSTYSATGPQKQRCGEPGGVRTHDPKIKSLVLYQLSYRSTSTEHMLW
jgi:hypothetical protein